MSYSSAVFLVICLHFLPRCHHNIFASITADFFLFDLIYINFFRLKSNLTFILFELSLCDSQVCQLVRCTSFALLLSEKKRHFFGLTNFSFRKLIEFMLMFWYNTFFEFPFFISFVFYYYFVFVFVEFCRFEWLIEHECSQKAISENMHHKMPDPFLCMYF